jgi:hypothetical protein
VECLLIAAEGESSMNGELTQGNQDLILMEEDSGNGKFWYDKAKGLIMKIERTGKRERVITMPSNPSFQATVTINLNSKFDLVTE